MKIYVILLVIITLTMFKYSHWLKKSGVKHYDANKYTNHEFLNTITIM